MSGKSVDFAQNKACYISFLQAFHADFNHVILEMILWPQLEGSQSEGTLGQALLPISAVTKGLNPLSVMPKQRGWLGPGKPSKTNCPLIAAMRSF